MSQPMYLSDDGPDTELVKRYYESLSSFWHPVLRVSDLPAERPIRAELLGRSLVVARLSGEVVVLDDVCRHFQARLSDGFIDRGCRSHDRDVLRCRYHGWAYDRTGHCVEIPQLKNNAQIPSAAKVGSYSAVVAHGLVWVCLAPSARHSIPDLAEMTSDGMVPTRLEYSSPWHCSAVRMILSALDDYHFAWLHEGVLGDRDRVEAPNRSVCREGTTLVSRFSQVQPANVTNKIADDGREARVDYEMRVDMPSVLRIIKKNVDGGTYVICFFAVPHTFNRTGIFWRVIRNYQTTPAEEEHIIKMEQFIQSQDKDLVGGQRPWLMPPLPIKEVDSALVAYLKWLRELGIPNNI